MSEPHRATQSVASTDHRGTRNAQCGIARSTSYHFTSSVSPTQAPTQSRYLGRYTPRLAPGNSLTYRQEGKIRRLATSLWGSTAATELALRNLDDLSELNRSEASYWIDRLEEMIRDREAEALKDAEAVAGLSRQSISDTPSWWALLPREF